MLESILRTKEHNVSSAIESMKNFGDPLQNADLAEIISFDVLEIAQERGDYSFLLLDMLRMMRLVRDFYLALACEKEQELLNQKEVEVIE